MRIYGLTGGIGSGKSEAARRFAALGIPVIDADSVGHAVIAPGGAAADEVAAAFGPEALTNGIIDREKVSARVFADPAALQTLNAIVLPAIYREIMRQCVARAEAGDKAIIIDAALLAEKGRKEPFLEGLIVVTCSAATRIARLVNRRGMDRADAERRIAAQAPPQRKVALADWVIENDGTLEELYAQVDHVAKAIGLKHAPATE